MHNIQINPICAQSPQAVLATLDDVPPAEASIVNLGAHAAANFSRQNDLRTLALQCFAEHFF